MPTLRELVFRAVRRFGRIAMEVGWALAAHALVLWGSLKRVGINAHPTRIGVSGGGVIWRVSGCLALHGGGEECVCAVFGGIRLQVGSRVQRDFLCA